MDYEFHPLANRYPLLGGLEFEDFKSGIEEAKRIREPIVLFEGKILDGRNRYRAGKQLGLKIPTRKYDEEKEGDPELFVQNANDDRRHELQEIIRRRRHERAKLIAEKKSQGKSNRTIAQEVGVSEKQVRDDLKLSGAYPPYAPENDPSEVENKTDTSPSKVTGKDGKNYPAKTKKQPKPEPKESEPEPEIIPPTPTDAIGIPIPEKLRSVFETRKLFSEARKLHRELTAKINEIALIEAVSAGHLRKDLSRRERDGNPYFRSTELESVKLLIDEWEPHVCVCPWCLRENNGKPQKSCKACYGQNWIPLRLWRQCSREDKERVERLVAE